MTSSIKFDIMMCIRDVGPVRTTLTIDDQLLEKAKHLAGAEGVSLGTIVNRSLRQTLLAPAATRANQPPFRMLTFLGHSALDADLSPAVIAALRDADTI